MSSTTGAQLDRVPITVVGQVVASVPGGTTRRVVPVRRKDNGLCRRPIRIQSPIYQQIVTGEKPKLHNLSCPYRQRASHWHRYIARQSIDNVWIVPESVPY